MAQLLIELKQLTKRYKSKTVLRDINLTVEKGDIFGLIGHNGAGKSTLLKLIGGLIHPTAGQVKLFGQATSVHNGIHDRMGLLIEQAGLYPSYTGRENLRLLSLAYGLRDGGERAERLLERVGLRDEPKTKVKNYSMGMKQRLGIAMALLASPDVLVLDEPINGLDPQGIADIRGLLLELNKQGLTLLISSHILEELSKVATRYAIIDRGEIIETLSREDLLSRCGERIELEVEAASAAAPILERDLQLTNYQVIDQHTLYIMDTRVKNHEIVAALVAGGVAVHSLNTRKQSLEDYFLERTGKGEGHNA
ncbi:ABC transporter ATP-binding protein [Paenibacillus daejeonensis]|uniref:ABC transporter ATP-binding protein n=1 Tax=Paenibacillus daejeonensis TaxID=135193 RepID=UPI00036E1E85|nr:ATP-binding cassette domain-containing protein [Paenibacillus daejeonensis]